jgi:putative inorganic carbon (HCO3(-)) transporter
MEVTDANWALTERIAHWQAAVGMLTDHPISGVGIGNYAVAYPQYAVGRWQDPLGHAHNFYLNIAAECGLLGLTVFLFLIGACFAYAWRVLQQLSSMAQCADAANARTIAFWRAVALGATGVLVHWSVHSLFDNLLVHHMNVQLALTLGLLVIAGKRCDARWN